MHCFSFSNVIFESNLNKFNLGIKIAIGDKTSTREKYLSDSNYTLEGHQRIKVKFPEIRSCIKRKIKGN